MKRAVGTLALLVALTITLVGGIPATAATKINSRLPPGLAAGLGLGFGMGHRLFNPISATPPSPVKEIHRKALRLMWLAGLCRHPVNCFVTELP
jgi:hypothetical protein